jgi:hypothetical protein
MILSANGFDAACWASLFLYVVMENIFHKTLQNALKRRFGVFSSI